MPKCRRSLETRSHLRIEIGSPQETTGFGIVTASLYARCEKWEHPMADDVVQRLNVYLAVRFGISLECALLDAT